MHFQKKFYALLQNLLSFLLPLTPNSDFDPLERYLFLLPAKRMFTVEVRQLYHELKLSEFQDPNILYSVTKPHICFTLSRQKSRI